MPRAVVQTSSQVCAGRVAVPVGTVIAGPALGAFTVRQVCRSQVRISFTGSFARAPSVTIVWARFILTRVAPVAVMTCAERGIIICIKRAVALFNAATVVFTVGLELAELARPATVTLTHVPNEVSVHTNIFGREVNVEDVQSRVNTVLRDSTKNHHFGEEVASIIGVGLVDISPFVIRHQRISEALAGERAIRHFRRPSCIDKRGAHGGNDPFGIDRIKKVNVIIARRILIGAAPEDDKITRLHG